MTNLKYLRIPQYEVRKYPKDQLEKVQRLFTQAYQGRKMSLDVLHWRMEQNPCLKERATSLWEDDILVAYNALTPGPAYLFGENIISAVSGTTMADEHYPGCSIQLFTECANQNQDIGLIIGFPNKNSYGITVKYVGHHYVGDVAFWTSTPRKIKVSDKISGFTCFTDEYEKISAKLSKDNDFIKKREKEYLNWRFFKHPYIEYKAYEYEKRGYIVVDIYREENMKQLQIIDIISESEDVMKELLNYAINLAHEWSCNCVKLWLTSEKYKHVLVSSGFVYGEHPFKMTVWDGDLDISKSYITMADSDNF